MTDDNMALTDLLQKTGEGDFLRTLAETVLQMLMEADVVRTAAEKVSNIIANQAGLSDQRGLKRKFRSRLVQTPGLIVTRVKVG